MTDDTNDDKLQERLADRLDFKSEDGGEGADGSNDSTESKGDDYDDEDDDEMEQDAETEGSDSKAGDVEEAAAAIAESSDEDVSTEDVVDMLEPILGGTESAMDGEDHDDEDDDEMEQDAEGELKAEDVEETVTDVVDEKLDDRLETAVEEKLDDLLGERIDSKLDGVVTEDRLEEAVSAIGEEVQDTMQKARTGTTPEANTGGGTDLSKDDLLSNGGDD